MESLVSGLVQPLATLLGSINANFQSLMTISVFRFTVVVLYTFVYTYLRYLEFFLLLRYLLFWFPNINPYTVPYVYIQIVTSPYERFFEKYTPRLFGLSFGYLLLTSSLGRLLVWLSRHPLSL
jgi:uncharacterized protein YggT (Ycf19 family)